MKKFYIKDLKEDFFITGSYGRYRYKKQIYLMLSKVSHTLPDLEDENTGKDLDILYIDNNGNEKLVKKFEQNQSLEIIQIKRDLIMLKHKHTKIRYDVFICSKEHFYTYYLFTLLGKKINIILRKKAIKKNLLLNQYGIFNRDTNEEIIINYDYTKNIFNNMLLILKLLYIK
jgi:DNA polymerase/3'-5' exonuclease PolX